MKKLLITLAAIASVSTVFAAPTVESTTATEQAMMQKCEAKHTEKQCSEHIQAMMQKCEKTHTAQQCDQMMQEKMSKKSASQAAK